MSVVNARVTKSKLRPERARARELDICNITFVFCTRRWTSLVPLSRSSKSGCCTARVGELRDHKGRGQGRARGGGQDDAERNWRPAALTRLSILHHRDLHPEIQTKPALYPLGIQVFRPHCQRRHVRNINLCGQCAPPPDTIS